MDLENSLTHLQKIKLIQNIHSNCQFLTLIRNIEIQEKPDNLPTLNQYIQTMKSMRINAQNFIQIFIQIAYFLYTCKYYAKNPHLTQQNFYVEQNYVYGAQKRFSIVIYYNYGQLTQQKTISYTAKIHQMFIYLLTFFQKYENTQVFQQCQAYMQIFKRQYKFIIGELQKLTKQQCQKQFFACLQETIIFRGFSILLQIKSNSILDLIKKNLHQKFKQTKRKDIEYMRKYRNQRSNRIHPKISQIRNQAKNIQTNILEFFTEIQKNSNNQKTKIIIVQNQNGRIKFRFQNQEMPYQPFKSRLKKVSTAFKDLMLEQDSDDVRIQGSIQNRYVRYLIQYCSQRSTLCVRLIFDLNDVNAESMDLLMFQSNALTFDSSNVSIQVLQFKICDPQNQQASNSRLQKRLAFKAASCLNQKQAPLQKILILMDMAMISSRIYQPFLNINKSPYLNAVDPLKLAQIHKKVNHYTKIYLKCARKVYNQ